MFDFFLFDTSIRPRFLNHLWNTSFISKQSYPGWSGSMNLITKSHSYFLCGKTVHKVKCRDVKHVISDQKFYVKAYKLVLSMKMEVFLCLEGLHQLMGFLGNIGSLLEGSGLEIDYAHKTVGQMFTGKAYSQPIRGHLLSASVLMLLMLQGFWNDLTSDRQEQMEEIYNSENPLVYENHRISHKLLF